MAWCLVVKPLCSQIFLFSKKKINQGNYSYHNTFLGSDTMQVWSGTVDSSPLQVRGQWSWPMATCPMVDRGTKIKIKEKRGRQKSLGGPKEHWRKWRSLDSEDSDSQCLWKSVWVGISYTLRLGLKFLFKLKWKTLT